MSGANRAVSEWLSGPEAVAELRRWCKAHGTTLGRLGALCAPPVHRSTFKRWAEGAAPQRAVWDRLTAARDTFDQRMMDYLLGGGA